MTVSDTCYSIRDHESEMENVGLSSYSFTSFLYPLVLSYRITESAHLAPTLLNLRGTTMLRLLTLTALIAINYGQDCSTHIADCTQCDKDTTVDYKCVSDTYNVPCTEFDSVCDACCTVKEMAGGFIPAQTAFDAACSTGKCPTPTPIDTPAPVDTPIETPAPVEVTPSTDCADLYDCSADCPAGVTDSWSCEATIVNVACELMDSECAACCWAQTQYGNYQAVLANAGLTAQKIKDEYCKNDVCCEITDETPYCCNGAGEYQVVENNCQKTDLLKITGTSCEVMNSPTDTCAAPKEDTPTPVTPGPVPVDDDGCAVYDCSAAEPCKSADSVTHNCEFSTAGVECTEFGSECEACCWAYTQYNAFPDYLESTQYVYDSACAEGVCAPCDDSNSYCCEFNGENEIKDSSCAADEILGIGGSCYRVASADSECPGDEYVPPDTPAPVSPAPVEDPQGGTCESSSSIYLDCPDNDSCEDGEWRIEVDLGLSVCKIAVYMSDRPGLVEDVKACIYDEVPDTDLTVDDLILLYNTVEDDIEFEAAGEPKTGYKLGFGVEFCGSQDEMEDVYAALMDLGTEFENVLDECLNEGALKRGNSDFECIVGSATLTLYKGDGTEVSSVSGRSSDGIMQNITFSVVFIAFSFFVAMFN